MKLFLIVAVLSGMLIPGTASAELDYNSYYAGYATTSYQNGDPTLTVMNFGFSNSAFEKVYTDATLGLGSQASNYSGVDNKVTSLSFGAGYHTSLKDNVDAILAGHLIIGSFKKGGNSSSANGYDASAAVRALFGKGFEGICGLVHSSASNDKSSSKKTFINLQLGFYFTPFLQMIAGVDLRDNYTSSLTLHYFY